MDVDPSGQPEDPELLILVVKEVFHHLWCGRWYPYVKPAYGLEWWEIVFPLPETNQTINSDTGEKLPDFHLLMEMMQDDISGKRIGFAIAGLVVLTNEDLKNCAESYVDDRGGNRLAISESHLKRWIRTMGIMVDILRKPCFFAYEAFQTIWKRLDIARDDDGRRAPCVDKKDVLRILSNGTSGCGWDETGGRFSLFKAGFQEFMDESQETWIGKGRDPELTLFYVN